MSSKRLLAIKEKYNSKDVLSLDECVSKIKEYKDAEYTLRNGKNAKLATKFNESVNVEFNLGVDGKRSDQMLKFALVLPHGHGKKLKILAITNKPEEVLKAGAEVCTKDQLSDVASGKFNLSNYDACIASEGMMKDIAVSGASKNLGMKGLMPNPKLGTVLKTEEAMINAISDMVYKNISLKSDKFGDLKCGFAKINFEDNAIKDNFNIILDKIKQSRPSSLKGILIKSINISTSGGFSCYLSYKM